MKTDREMLIDLLDMNFGYVKEMKADELADYLISKGVTIPVNCDDCIYVRYTDDVNVNFCTLPKERKNIVTPDGYCGNGEARK